MPIELILPLLTAFGLGSIITALVQTWLQNNAATKKRSFEERKQAYVGLLEAYHAAAVQRTDEAAKNFAYWQMRCDLVAPPSVRNAIEKIVESNENVDARHKAHDQLKNALRSDLGISKI